MPQKINPISNKLGLIKNWNYELPKYGHNFKNYTKFILPRNYIFNYINRFCLNYDLLIENINITHTTTQTNINISIYFLKNLELFSWKESFLNVISKWTNSFIKLSFYKASEISDSSCLISNYINFLFIQKSTSLKKILLLIYKALKNQTKQVRIKYTISGIKIIELKGFKIEITGCFESSRSQMAKTIKCNFGTIPLTKLNGYIDYTYKTFFTKFGTCGLKIWLFYELK